MTQKTLNFYVQSKFWRDFVSNCKLCNYIIIVLFIIKERESMSNFNSLAKRTA